MRRLFRRQDSQNDSRRARRATTWGKAEERKAGVSQFSVQPSQYATGDGGSFSDSGRDFQRVLRALRIDGLAGDLRFRSE